MFSKPNNTLFHPKPYITIFYPKPNNTPFYPKPFNTIFYPKPYAKCNIHCPMEIMHEKQFTKGFHRIYSPLNLRFHSFWVEYNPRGEEQFKAVPEPSIGVASLP